MKNERRSLEKSHIALAFLGLTLLPFGVAAAVPKQCINQKDQCNPSLLCSFEADLAAKIATYQALLANSQQTRTARNKTRDGIRYNGRLYDAALAEAEEKYKDESEAVQREQVANIFNTKLREHLLPKLPKFMSCSVDGIEADKSILPSWDGMHTSDDCNIYGDVGEKSVLLSDLKKDTVACQEFFERDVGHEQIHQERCYQRGRKPAGDSPDGIDEHIEEEIDAYRYSIQRGSNDVKLLGQKCSVDPNLKTRRARAKALANNLKLFKAK
jgi:hypothetical protein